MITISRCQRCSRLPPPPPIFSLNPPPNLLSIDIHCPSRLQHKKITSSSSSSIVSTPIIFGFLIGLFISITVVLFIKNRMIKRKYHAKNDHHQPNWTKSIPLLSDSCSSDQTISTPVNDYPCSIFDDIHHEYEQINSTNSSHYYCLIYCRQCASYHQTSRTSCTCQMSNENSFFELQPMFKTKTDCFDYS